MAALVLQCNACPRLMWFDCSSSIEGMVNVAPNGHVSAKKLDFRSDSTFTKAIYKLCAMRINRYIIGKACLNFRW